MRKTSKPAHMTEVKNSNKSYNHKKKKKRITAFKHQGHNTKVVNFSYSGIAST